MLFYDLSKEQRRHLTDKITGDIISELESNNNNKIYTYFGDADTYIRKSAYLSAGKIYFAHKNLKQKIIRCLNVHLINNDFKIRQTVINAAGEIGKKDFDTVQHFFDRGLFDKHPSPRNAVIGSIKKMGAVNPVPVLRWAKKYLHHPDKEIRREICHGIELRGREHPEEILPLLKELQHDGTARVRNTLVHVIGQISYEKSCLKTVIDELKTWDNEKVVTDALAEILDVHERYKKFSALTQEQAAKYIKANYR